MSPSTITAIIMGVFVVAFIGIDVFFAVDRVVGNTYSERMRVWAKAWPPLRLMVAFGMGMLCGHWWWSSAC